MAVAGAASTVMTYLFPDGAARIEHLAAQGIALDSRPPRATIAFALGRRVGESMIVRAASDGSSATWMGTAPSGPGFWVPTPTASIFPPVEPLAGTWRTWNLRAGSQFRPRPPPRYGTPRFLAELNEVHLVSQSLTDEQKRIADFWADGAGTVMPSGH